MAQAALLCATAATLALAAPAAAQTYAVPVDVRGGPLPEALIDLAEQTGAEVLFDRNRIGGFRSSPVRGRMTADAAFAKLLTGTNLVVRRSPSGMWVVEPPSAPPMERLDVTLPELLVVGRRSQNADIRRLETDIQPYRVVSGDEITSANRDHLDQFLRARVPSNTSASPPSLDTRGETISEVDLRGIGPSGTLVLIDGRRMPSIPVTVFGFRQTDINAVPLHAIERIEILTGAAGGIHGFGALGGVVNVVLARDRPGVETHATAGLSSRGDAGQFSLEGRIGFTSSDSRTDVDLYVGGSRSEPLANGRRRYLDADRQISAANAPRQIVALGPNANSVFVASSSGGSSLTFKPQYGGATIPSNITFLPVGLSGVPDDLVGALTRNAGRFDAGLSEGMAEAPIGSSPQLGALLANVRHRFDGGIETYLDVVMLWNRGDYRGQGRDPVEFLPASSPNNPFTRDIQISYPLNGPAWRRTSEVMTSRYTAGVLFPLAVGWKGAADLAIGRAQYDYAQQTREYSNFLRPPNVRAPNPFGEWTAFQTAASAYISNSISRQTIKNDFTDVALRLSGPVFRTTQGPATLSLLAERRVEEVPGYAIRTDGDAGLSIANIASRKSATSSLYAELRTRVFGDDAPVEVLRALEVQLAVREDTETDEFARNPRAPTTTERLKARFHATTYTLGAKVSPAPWLTLRGSYATGATPPALPALIEVVVSPSLLGGERDPKRPGEVMGNEVRSP
ncbi:TonB-dependent receptor [Phenylobacterium koreense]|uniref:Outer membrane receptor protein involved in Fe transport n=1 Tax=Phenylobacterium koreense TaxID=266125 RepID=A0ABV2EN95_9CAUL